MSEKQDKLWRLVPVDVEGDYTHTILLNGEPFADVLISNCVENAERAVAQLNTVPAVVITLADTADCLATWMPYLSDVLKVRAQERINKARAALALIGPPAPAVSARTDPAAALVAAARLVMEECHAGTVGINALRAALAGVQP